MVSPHLARTAADGDHSSLLEAGAAQSEPWQSQSSAVAPAAVYEPIVQTLHSLAWSWMTFSLVGASAGGSAVMMAFSSLISLPPEPNCSDLEPEATHRDNLTCLQQAIAAGQPEALPSGLAFVGRWQPTDPLFNEGTQLLEQWSDPAFQQAQEAYANGTLSQAASFAAEIPHGSSHYIQAQALLQSLSEEQYRLAAPVYEAAQVALQQQDWANAFQALWALETLDHPKLQTGLTQTVAQQIETERQATRLLNTAVQQQALGTPQDQGHAIAIASQIDPSTYVWQTAQPLLDQWSDELFPLAQYRLAKGDVTGATEIVQQIAKNPNRRSLAQDWLILVQANRLATVSLAQESSLTTQIGLYPAVLATRSIQPESVWRSHAMTQAHLWEDTFKARSPVLIRWASDLQLPQPHSVSRSSHQQQHQTPLPQNRTVEVSPQPLQPMFSDQQRVPALI
ncbi:hypothetical protein PN498_00275 [Oscillatoria sp. CS-180]|uniref:hypothetical protein n=1 Tax=Oscillatoria sp. CS-180 TaxID=3021720 RepID=UPI00232B6488|nr:hypothetical protein [Oscillatoria sp. CS-180]MDB9524406.1 hypothetical protein [Oscillatoria sp. CS-180]